MFSNSRDILIGFLLVCVAAWGLMGTRGLRFADRSVYDAQASWLRTNKPTPLAKDVVVIGLDEAAYETIPEPTALWHVHFSTLLAGLSSAKPAVVGLAMPLPVRSYDFLIKDIDATLISGIYLLRSTAPLVVGQPLRPNQNSAAKPASSNERSAGARSISPRPSSERSAWICTTAPGSVRLPGSQAAKGTGSR